MKIYKGTIGLDQTFQDEFPATMQCHKCKGEARVMFVAAEDREIDGYICQLHRNKGIGGY